MSKKIDYIRKDDAIRYAQWEGAYKVVMYLEELKAEDVQPVRRGRWIAENRDSRGYADCYTCTNCNCYSYTYTLMKECEYEYCPKCGARMDGDTLES